MYNIAQMHMLDIASALQQCNVGQRRDGDNASGSTAMLRAGVRDRVRPHSASRLGFWSHLQQKCAHHFDIAGM